MKVCPVRAELFLGDKRPYMTNLTVTFRNFMNAYKNETVLYNCIKISMFERNAVFRNCVIKRSLNTSMSRAPALP